MKGRGKNDTVLGTKNSIPPFKQPGTYKNHYLMISIDGYTPIGEKGKKSCENY